VYEYPIGVVSFCIVQVLYNVRFGGARRLKILPLTLAVPLVFFVITNDALVAIALLYAQLFLLSYAAMLKAIRKKTYPAPNSLLIFIGMTAFVLCDICVAIWNLSRMGIIANTEVASFASTAIWLFYTPSQICLALSSRNFVGATFGRPLERGDTYS